MTVERPPPWPPPTGTGRVRESETSAIDTKYANRLRRFVATECSGSESHNFDCCQQLPGKRYDANGEDGCDYWEEDVLWFPDEGEPTTAPPMIVFGDEPDRVDDDDDTYGEEEDSNRGTPIATRTFAQSIWSRFTLAALLKRRPPTPFCSGPGKRRSTEASRRSPSQCPIIERSRLIVGIPRSPCLAGTDPLCHCGPPDPRPQAKLVSCRVYLLQSTDLAPDPRTVPLRDSVGCLHARRIFLTQSADLAPDPLRVPQKPWLGSGPWDVSRPLSADLAPDPGDDRPFLGDEFCSRAVPLSCPCHFLSGTDVIGFRCPPNPMFEDMEADKVLAVPPGTAVLFFWRPPDP